jgi:hypothetical protein
MIESTDRLVGWLGGRIEIAERDRPVGLGGEICAARVGMGLGMGMGMRVGMGMGMRMRMEMGKRSEERDCRGVEVCPAGSDGM